MQDSLFRYLEGSRQAVRYWWLLLAGGVILFLIGVVVFAFPVQSYVGMAVLFGWLMLLTGVVETIVAVRNTHYVTGRGWMLAWGVIEIVLGLILVFNVALSSATLPVVLGFWLLMRGFSAVGLGGDMRAVGIRGAGWTILCGILLLLCALGILFQPLVFGSTAVVVWVGLSLLLAGASAALLGLQLRTAHRVADKQL
ncbi:MULTISPECIES: DUF308 domain-containing protein [unclassified Alistipes]|jgi:uncharacterized membrane protein HdeD (DUF308 family)|uniref:HdeD family acid-resistance protein n=1 Tax=unclassified Alistipes TaxID=2608932 RepID=UPI000D0F9B6A|nr:DUF308 domain-containing protein [Alistipes sp. Marseille-P5061]HIV33107.1 DUF308 domain-containing protein [Candidatus Alistipes excrementigallinarum]